MRTKLLLFAMACCLATTGWAQQVIVEGPRPLAEGTPGFYPVLNSTGDRLLFSDMQASGLNLLEIESGSLTRVSNEPGAGIDAVWDSNNGIFYVTQQTGTDNLVYRSGHRYDLTTQQSTMVLEPQHGAVLPHQGRAGVVLAGEKKTYRSTRDLVTTVYTEGSSLVIERGASRKVCSPVDCYAGYLWASLSPEADKVAFVAAGKGVFVVDLDGNLLSSLGRYEMPSWLNNDYLVVQNTTDDGHQFTSSQLLLLKADGTFSHALTAPSSMTMQPSAAAGRVAYTTIDGRLQLMDIKITE